MRKLPSRSTRNPVDWWYRASVIKKALDCSQKTVANCAQREGWPRRKRKNFFEYAVPMPLAEKCAALVAKEEEPQRTERELKDVEASLTRNQRARLLFRLAAVTFYKHQIAGAGAVTNQVALARTVGFLAPVYRIAERTLDRLVTAYDDSGIEALVDQRAGRSGRRKSTQSAEAR